MACRIYIESKFFSSFLIFNMFLKKKSSQLLRKVGTEPLRKQKQDLFETDLVYENERGSILFKNARFSKRSLLPTDPSPYSDSKVNPVVDMKYYICPPGWEWISEWIIDMKDTDDEGWSYNSSFSNLSGWSSALPMNQVSAVRRRKWIRMRKVTGNVVTQSLEKLNDAEGVIKLVQQKRNDREKLTEIGKLILDCKWIETSLMCAMVSQLDFQSSKLKALLLVAPAVSEAGAASLYLQCLDYFSDKLELMKSMNLPIEACYAVVEQSS